MSRLDPFFFVALAVVVAAPVPARGDVRPARAEAAERDFGRTDRRVEALIDALPGASDDMSGQTGFIGAAVDPRADQPYIFFFYSRKQADEAARNRPDLPEESFKVSGRLSSIAGVGNLDTESRVDRPVPIGVSTGSMGSTAGTIGCRLLGKSGGVYALSNNHVLAGSNYVARGGTILQPGRLDGGRFERDAMGTLAEFRPIDFRPGARNRIDAAIIATSTDLIADATPPDGYGRPLPGVLDAKDLIIGLRVMKYGKESRCTVGRVSAIGGIFLVDYGSDEAWFMDQIVITPEPNEVCPGSPGPPTGSRFAEKGDSGALVVAAEGEPRAVGLVFAGSEHLALANRIDLVLEAFGARIDGGSMDGP